MSFRKTNARPIERNNVAKPKAATADTATVEKDEATAALEESKDEAKSVEWRGITLELPAKLPGTLAWDFAALEGSREYAGLVGLVRTIVGEQDALIQAKVAEDGIGLEDIVEELGNLVTSIVEQYGTTEGE